MKVFYAAVLFLQSVFFWQREIVKKAHQIIVILTLSSLDSGLLMLIKKLGKTFFRYTVCGICDIRQLLYAFKISITLPGIEKLYIVKDIFYLWFPFANYRGKHF